MTAGYAVVCDLHIHTALSPCADNDMTPNNIVNMATLCGIDVIAITDHNSARNARAAIEAAQGTGVIVIPGMEAETSEEIHVVCLFGTPEAAEAFGIFIEAGLPGIANKPEIYGEQLVMDKEDKITEAFAPLLVTASSYSIDEILRKTAELGGASYPAHIDRESNGILSVLGSIPEELDIPCVEISKNFAPEMFPHLPNYTVVKASDAHHLWEIGENLWEIALPQKPSAQTVVDFLRGVL